KAPPTGRDKAQGRRGDTHEPRPAPRDAARVTQPDHPVQTAANGDDRTGSPEPGPGDSEAAVGHHDHHRHDRSAPRGNRGERGSEGCNGEGRTQTQKARRRPAMTLRRRSGQASRLSLIAAGATLALAVTIPAYGQGNGKGKDHKSTPPSQSVLPSPTISGGASASGAAPLAWI